MFARKVSVHLKANGAAEFKKKIESEVIPLLRKQAGFLDEITFLYPSGREPLPFGLRATRDPAGAYNRAAYPEVTTMLGPVIEGTARVESSSVLSYTIQKCAAGAACPHW